MRGDETNRTGAIIATVPQLGVASYPLLLGQNPYQRLLLDALEARGVRTAGADLPFRPGVSRRLTAQGIDAVHLHWLEFLYTEPGSDLRSAVLTHKRAALLTATLGELRRSDVRVVWTVHNLRPHETRFPRLTDAVIRRAIRASDALVVHSRHAAGRLGQAFSLPREPVIAPHPNYHGAYPPPSRGRVATRRELGIPEDSFAYLMFGQIRPYKRVPEAIDALAAVDDPRLRLVVAGGVADPALEAAVRARAERDDRVVLRLEAVGECAVTDLHSACDAAFLHYRDVFSSGALMLALTLGLGVVAPRNTTADEIAGPPAVEAYDGDDAAAALARMAAGDPQRRRAAALDAAGAHTWSDMAATLQPLLAGR